MQVLFFKEELLKKGFHIIAGNVYGRVKTLCNGKGQLVNETELPVAVEVYEL